MSIDEHTAIISDLEQVERETEQQINATRQEKAKVLKKINQLKQQTERRRVHKMIVLGSVIWDAYRKRYKIDDEKNEQMMRLPDDRMRELGKTIITEYFENI